MNQEEIYDLNRLITRSKIEFVIKKTPSQQSPEPDCFTGEFYQTYNEELIPTLLKLFQIITEDETLPNSFYKATITLILKPKTLQKKTITGQYL